MSRRELIREVGLAAALGMAFAVGLVAIRRAADARDELAAFRPAAARAEAQDRLTGTRLDVDSLLGRRTGRRSGAHILLWVLDLDRCSFCLADIGQWIRLEDLEDHDLELVLVGEPNSAARIFLRTLRKTHVTQLDQQAVFSQLGSVLPSTKFLLDPQGVAILVDSRVSGRSCGWSFESQIGTLKGLNSASAIRFVQDSII